MKKSRRKLITALMLIIVAATIVGTASYAWFTMNDRVNAGMDIEAVAAKNLVISKTSDGTYTTAVNFQDPDATVALHPVSTANLKDWYIPEGDTGISYDTGAISDDTTFEKLTDLSEHVRSATVYVKADMNENDTPFTKVYVNNITVKRAADTDEQSEITKALRIGIVCGTTTLIFDYDDYNASTLVISSIDGDKKAVTTLRESDKLGVDDAVIATNVGDTPVEVQIFLWYEGQDEDCKSHNSIKVENVEVIVEFQGIRS